MATKAMIAMKVSNKNGKQNSIKAVFSHWDGYPYALGLNWGLGYELITMYNTTEKVEQLLSRGYIDAIRKDHSITYYNKYIDDSTGIDYPICTNYITPKEFADGALDDIMWERGVFDIEFGYYWTGSMWVIADYCSDIIMPLKDYLKIKHGVKL